MLDLLFWACAAASAAATAGLWISAAFAVGLLRRRARPAAAPSPMTMIKPIKGLEDELDANLESLAVSDPDGRLQILIAIESPADPAWTVAAAFAARHPGRDIELVETGPAGGRMGKTHNMIAALPRAKHERLVFSDADVQATPELLAETSRAFDDGCEAVFALPLHRRTPGLGGLLFEGAMNHSYLPAAALAWRLGILRPCAGAWMGFTAPALARAGGLEPLSREIAEDFALSRRVAACGLKAALLPTVVPLRESGTTFREALVHLAKWASIIRWSVPAFYAAVPLGTPGTTAAAACALAWALGAHQVAAAAVAAAAFGSRAVVAAVQDAAFGDGLGAPWRYAALALTDVGAMAFWASGFRRRIQWRGVRYRLSHGGRAEVLS